MTKRIGNKHIAQHRSLAERKRIKADNIAREAIKRDLAKSKYHNEVKGRISAAQAAAVFTSPAA